MSRILKSVLRFLILLTAIVATVWMVRGYSARDMPELRIWHTVKLHSEFRARDYPDGITFPEYRKLEARLRAELGEKIYGQVNASAAGKYNRFDPGSDVHPAKRDASYNWSFERVVDDPKGGVLLLHGASDSPYSVRSLAAIFQAQQLYVLALRVPGNGTIPSGLKDARLEDWLAVTRMGVSHVQTKLNPELPLYLGGYSTGASMILDYTLDAVDDPQLALPERLFLFSPAVGVTSYARFASWDLALSKIPYFEKFAWVSIAPEYEPFKYNSFPKTAGHIVYQLTQRIHEKIDALKMTDKWLSLPSIISFQSVVDSTVDIEALMAELYDQLPENGSELVLFDLNRISDVRNFIVDERHDLLSRLNTAGSLPYAYTLVTNQTETTRAMQARTRRAGGANSEDLPYIWPDRVYSLSHVAIPFMPDDPWYGAIESDGFTQRMSLGTLAPRGEQNVLLTPLDKLMRLRYNPFFDYVERRMLNFCPVCLDTRR
jgi:alpha-beta hydrolase superfamily lysophospholipase